MLLLRILPVQKCWLIPMMFAVGIFGFAKLQGGMAIGDSSIKCRDESGNFVDWFILYKLPRVHNSSNQLVRQGLGFVSILPDSKDWQLSARGIDHPQSPAGNTLQPLYNGNERSQLAYILYNDQPPAGLPVFTGGHTKGVILALEGGGLWLQHSVPHYPPSGDKLVYPLTGENNGQILHCLTLSLREVDKLGSVLNLTKPHIYASQIPAGLRDKLPTLSRVIQGQGEGRAKVKGQENLMVKITTLGERAIYSFAKGPSWHEEIYADWIAPNWSTELDVQSWLNGPHPYPSNCTSSGNKVYNVADKDVAGFRFSTHQDHAKWAIAVKKELVCVGDLNRMEHQTKRGGAVNCFMDKNVWKAFKKSVVSTQPCPKPGKKGLLRSWKKELENSV